jgi:large subunit ribosomal protein L9
MNIILLERVEKLGQMGEFVSVKSGYARNFLLPQGKAVFASKENIKMFEEKKSQLEGENITRKKEAQNLADNIKFKEVVLIRAASESGQLYGSVSAKDISNVVTEAGLSINKSQINLNKAIKTLSYEDIYIKLHPEISIKLKLNIARSLEEAKEQTKSGQAIITTEITGGDIRSERAQKDARRFDKKENLTKTKNETERKLETPINDINGEKKEKKDKINNCYFFHIYFFHIYFFHIYFFHIYFFVMLCSQCLRSMPPFVARENDKKKPSLRTPSIKIYNKIYNF